MRAYLIFSAAAADLRVLSKLLWSIVPPRCLAGGQCVVKYVYGSQFICYCVLIVCGDVYELFFLWLIVGNDDFVSRTRRSHIEIWFRFLMKSKCSGLTLIFRLLKLCSLVCNVHYKLCHCCTLNIWLRLVFVWGVRYFINETTNCSRPSPEPCQPHEPSGLCGLSQVSWGRTNWCTFGTSNTKCCWCRSWFCFNVKVHLWMLKVKRNLRFHDGQTVCAWNQTPGQHSWCNFARVWFRRRTMYDDGTRSSHIFFTSYATRHLDRWHWHATTIFNTYK